MNTQLSFFLVTAKDSYRKPLTCTVRGFHFMSLVVDGHEHRLCSRKLGGIRGLCVFLHWTVLKWGGKDLDGGA